jgi:murein L,D-transpeptidase YcbB/YkuD
MKTPTIIALRKYQKANGLKSTGKIDHSTQEALIIDMLEA